MQKVRVFKIERSWSPGLFTCITDGIHTTRITDPDGWTYTGHGWAQEEADRKADEKLRAGARDSI